MMPMTVGEFAVFALLVGPEGIDLYLDRFNEAERKVISERFTRARKDIVNIQNNGYAPFVKTMFIRAILDAQLTFK